MKYIKIIFFALIISLFCVGCTNDYKEENNTKPPDNIVVPSSLVKKWENTIDLNTPESVVYDDETRLIYVSNVNMVTTGNPWSHANNGFISKLAKDGTMITKRWATGLESPKGLAIHNGHLYVADIDSVVDINITNGTILHTYSTASSGLGTNFLNDIVYDSSTNALYISEYVLSIIVKFDLNTNTFSKIYDKEPLANGTSNQNGLFMYGNKLVMQSIRGSLKYLDLATNTAHIISSSIDNIAIDGLWGYYNLGFFGSDFNGHIYFINKDGTSKLLPITGLARPAGISYSKVLKLLLVANFDKKIIAYEVK